MDPGQSKIETLLPEGPREEALARAAEEIVAAVSAIPSVRHSFDLRELLNLHLFGLLRVPASAQERFTTTFAMSASQHWLLLVGELSDPVALCIFWRTKNANVDLRREIPKPNPHGNIAYIGWCWSKGGKVVTDAMREKILKLCGGIEFIAWHDNRKRLKRRARGRLWVMELSR